MKFWNTAWFHTVLHLIGVGGTMVIPILVASGVGIPAAVVAVAASAGGVAFKLAKSPITLASVVAATGAGKP